jgi:hypothetical protein
LHPSNWNKNLRNSDNVLGKKPMRNSDNVRGKKPSANGDMNADKVISPPNNKANKKEIDDDLNLSAQLSPGVVGSAVLGGGPSSA